MTYLHVYRAPSGQWSGKVLEEVAGIGGCEHPVDVLHAAREQFPGIEDLPADAPAPGSSYTTMTYQAASGEWAWMLFQDRMLIESGSPCRSEAEAEAQADAVLASFINDPELAPVSINHGVDFERALEHLQAEAGRLFRAYREAKATGTPEAAAQARSDYMAAQERADSLRLHDEAGIRAVLGE